MARVVKESRERKMELIDVAEAFFAEKGYEDTSVEDILQKVGIAKGTFYYHFKSKEALMEALIDRNVERLEQEIRGIVEDRSIPVPRKIKLLIGALSSLRAEKEAFVDFLYHEHNHALRQKFFAKLNQGAIPLMAHVMEEGTNEGFLDVPYPRETTEILAILVENQYEYDRMAESLEERYRKTRAMENAIERLLGVQKGSISLIL